MLRSQMFRAVVQTVLLSVIASVISQHLLSNAYENISKHALFKNFTDAMDLIESQHLDDAPSGVNVTAGGNGTLLNGTSAFNETKGFNITSADLGLDNRTFYKETLPLEVFYLILLSPLYYIWHLWLERKFPARPKATVSFEHDLKGGENSLQEEEVIQKWIASGKIRRSSLSWWNTFVKWILNLILAPLWMDAIKYVLEQTYHLRLPKWDPVFNSWQWELFDFILSAGVVPFFGIRPLSTLIGFAVIPAHQRMVFESGIRLVWKSFCAAFIQIIVPWFADTEIAAMMVGNMTEGARSEIAKHQPRPASLPDEL